MLSKNTIKHLTSLHHKKYRNEYKEFVVEGEKIVAEAIEWKKDAILKVYCLVHLADAYNSSNVAVVVTFPKQIY